MRAQDLFQGPRGAVIVGAAMMAAGMAAYLGLRTWTTLPPAAPAAALTRSQIERTALAGAKALFPRYRVIALYVASQPQFVYHAGRGHPQRLKGGEVLLVLGRDGKAALAAQEYVDSVEFAQAPVIQQSGWQIPALSPPGTYVREQGLSGLSPAMRGRAAAWVNTLSTAIALKSRIAVWPFSNQVLVVATARGQSAAALLGASGAPETILTQGSAR